MGRKIRPTFLNMILMFGGAMATVTLYVASVTMGFSHTWIGVAAKIGVGAGLCFATLITLLSLFDPQG